MNIQIKKNDNNILIKYKNNTFEILNWSYIQFNWIKIIEWINIIFNEEELLFEYMSPIRNSLYCEISLEQIIEKINNL